jgi:hypothetical protein
MKTKRATIDGVRRYRKKPVVIEALRFDGGNWKEIDWFLGNDAIWQSVHDDTEVAIKTLEGIIIASCGDFIIKGVKGEFYPCKPEIFEATYEAA